MKWIRKLSDVTVVSMIGILATVLALFFIYLFSELGMIAIIGTGWLNHTLAMLKGYLGYSIPFFIIALIGCAYYFLRLMDSLGSYKTDSETHVSLVPYYNSGVDNFIVLFFAIGVLFTAWGLQNALESALGGMTKTQAGQIGAFGILKRLVDNGILIALWTTVVGGAFGYFFRLLKFLCAGKKLNAYSAWKKEQEKQAFIDQLAASISQQTFQKNP